MPRWGDTVAEGPREGLVNRKHEVISEGGCGLIQSFNVICASRESPKVRLRKGALGLTALESMKGLEGLRGLELSEGYYTVIGVMLE